MSEVTTLEYSEFVRSITSKASKDDQAFTDRTCDLAYSSGVVDMPYLLTGIIGLADEASEVLEVCWNEDWDKLPKEMGDVRFYLEQIITALEANDSDAYRLTFHEPRENHEPIEEALFDQAIMLSIASGKLLGLAKKFLFQGKEPIDNLDLLAEEAANAISIFDSICMFGGFTEAEIRTGNHEKLTARFGGSTFSVEKSENREEGDV